MPILHIKLESDNQNIVLSRPIHAQQLTLKRVVVRKRCTVVPIDAPTTLPNSEKEQFQYEGGIMIFLPNLLTGYEINTNFSNQNGIPVFFPDTCAAGSSEFDDGRPIAYNTGATQVVQDTTAIYDKRYDMNFSQFDDIPENIQTKIRRLDGQFAPPFVGRNGLLQIDLFFEYAEVYEYDTY